MSVLTYQRKFWLYITSNLLGIFNIEWVLAVLSPDTRGNFQVLQGVLSVLSPRHFRSLVYFPPNLLDNFIHQPGVFGMFSIKHVRQTKTNTTKGGEGGGSSAHFLPKLLRNFNNLKGSLKLLSDFSVKTCWITLAPCKPKSLGVLFIKNCWRTLADHREFHLIGCNLHQICWTILTKARPSRTFVRN